MVTEICNEKDEEEDIFRDETDDILNIRSVTYQISFSYFFMSLCSMSNGHLFQVILM
uniref:Uncharacterized protein n=1 Tax=Rhizophora mucronata TaxID=61149 RepID=A0A2P2J377_RHIMU